MGLRKTKKIININNLRRGTVGLEDTKDLGASDVADLANAVRVTKDDTNLRGGQALLSELANVLVDLLGGDLEPRGRSALVRDGASRNTLSTRTR